MAARVPEDDRPQAYLPVAPEPARHARWIRAAVVLGLLAFVALFSFADLRELWRTVAQTNAWLLPLPLLCVLASYLTMARSYQGIGRAAGFHLPFWEMLKITFVANTSNYLLATGGLSGFAVRMYFFTRHEIPIGTAVVISLAQTFMTNVTLLLFVLGGFLYLFAAHNLGTTTLIVIGVLLAFLVAAAIAAAVLLFHARLRRRMLFWLAQTAHWFMHRTVPHRTPPRTHIWRYQFNLNRGIAFLLARKRQMAAPLLYIAIDWVFTMLVLHTAFLALRYPIALTYVVVGFAGGVALSLVSLIPGGLGVMEGSMAAIFAGFGVPFEIAVVAVLLFRVTYYVVPLLISLLFIHQMLAQGTDIRSALRSGDVPGRK